MRDIRNHSPLHRSTFGIDVSCRRLIKFSTKAELLETLSRFTEADYSIIPLGKGSNLLLTKGFDDTVLCSNIRLIDTTISNHQTIIRSGSGVMWDDSVATCVEQGAYDLENLSLIPGTVDAVAVQNIGAYDNKVNHFIHSIMAVEVATGREVKFARADCQYAYQYGKFKDEWKSRFIITHVEFRFDCIYRPHLDYGNIRAALQRQGIEHPTPQQLRQTIIAIHQARLPDPQVQGNAGSFFMNPIVDRKVYERLTVQYPQMPHYTIDDEREKIPADWLIDQCGWKGRFVKAVSVHDRRAFVLVSRGGITGGDVVELYEAIRHDVFQRFDIIVKPEVNIL